ncbi:MAG: hypothetical protein WC822_05585 [Candidatus Paceibacterota bacterium]
MPKHWLMKTLAFIVFCIAVDAFALSCISGNGMAALSWGLLCVVIFAIIAAGSIALERIARLEQDLCVFRRATIAALGLMEKRVSPPPQVSPPPPPPAPLRTMPTPAQFIPLEALIRMAEEMERRNCASRIPDINFAGVTGTLRKRLEAEDPHGTPPEIRIRAEQLLARLSKRLN